MAAVDQDLLGGGLDIEGWSYIKKDVATKIADMTDRTTVLRNTFPMTIKSKIQSEKLQEIITLTLEAKSSIDVSFIGKHYRNKTQIIYSFKVVIYVAKSINLSFLYFS